ncbi:hypothetical protein AX15_007793 [Amanita polypyramis BW_CC]|nr:hypothetical protein AX15_007793 [Amanita polypyramis BW_CC]
MMDSGRGVLSYPERLNALIDRHRAWQILQWKRVATVDINGPCSAYELVAGVFAKTSGRDMLFSWLPGASSAGHAIHIEDVGFQMRDFAIDPTQDLVVMLEENSTVNAFDNDLTRNVRLHLRTMSTMEPHPKARLPELRLDANPQLGGNHITATFMQIASDILAVFLKLELQINRLVLWNWQDGQLLSDLPYACWDYGLISPRSFMTTTIEDDGVIMLYKFSYPDKPIPTLVATLHLPKPQDGRVLLFLSSHTGPFLANPPHGTDFTTGPESRIQVFSADYQNTNAHTGNPHYTALFYVHNKTFQKYIENFEHLEESLGENDGSKMDIEPADVPWNYWGQESTLLHIVHSPPHWLRYVQGTRVVCTPKFYNGRTIMEVYDLPEERARKCGLLHGGPVSRLLFQSPVKTCLHYHSQPRIVEERYEAFMIDEERVIGLKVDPTNRDLILALHVYCF